MSVTTLEYTIYLDDAERAAWLQAQRPWTHTLGAPLNSGWFQQPARSPDWVGKFFGCPKAAAMLKWTTTPAGQHTDPAPPGTTSIPILTDKGAFQAPSIGSPWITANDQTTNPIDKDQFTRRKGGFWSWITCWFTDCDETYQWIGHVEFSPGKPSDTGGTTPTAVEAIRERRWIDGFEHPLGGEGGGLAQQELFSRAASRHADGFGLAFRSAGGLLRTHQVTEHGATASPKSWERFYIRPRAFPSGKVPFWRSHGSISNSAGIQLAIESTGRVSINDTTPFNVMSQVGQSAQALDLNLWHRIDLVFSYGTGASGAGSFFELWINGVLSVNIVSFDSSGLGGLQNHSGSEMGNVGGYDTRNLGLDVDDWMNAVAPNSDIVKRTGNDWKNGSRMVAIQPTGPSDSMGAWVGDWRLALQEPADPSTMILTSSTSADVLAFKTNAELAIDAEKGSIGAAALVVSLFGERDGVGNGQLGFSVNGAAPTYENMVENVVPQWNSTMLRPAGALTPTDMTPLEIFHTKATGGSQARVFTFVAEAELLGAWGNEDVIPSGSSGAPVIVTPTGIHDAPYPRTAWARNTDVPPVAPVAIIAGTYTGNDTGQDLVFQFPPTWLMIRNVDEAVDKGVNWWSSMFSAHNQWRNQCESSGLVAVLVDPEFEVVSSGENDQMQRYLVRIGGDQSNLNAVGQTYAYTAFCDPGMRFTLNGAITWPRGTSDRITKLFRTNFTPEAVFLHDEAIGGSTNVSTYYKGRGHATQSISKLDVAETASAIVLDKGQIVTRSPLHGFGGNQLSFAAFRRQDGSFDPGVPKVMQVFSYAGDGTGNRDIAFDTVSGVRPLWALVVPHDAAAVYRDSEHPGTSSTQVPATPVAANGIRGGDIDVLKVGSQLNVVGKTYDVFILPGGTAACNGGFSCPGVYVPVPPIPPPGYGGCPVIDMAPSSLPSGVVGTGYSRTITASGGQSPYTFSLANGALPDGLGLSGGGVISGTPTSNETKVFSIAAVDANGCTGERSYSISFNVGGCPDITIEPNPLPEASVGVAYSQVLTASGGAAPYTFSIEAGSLPQGFLLAANGTLSGALVAVDASLFTVRATDINGCFGEAELGLVPGGTPTGGGPTCDAASAAIVNRALSRIGITKAIVDLATDKTPEATTARLHFTNDVDTVLRDFPWPFATKYATLQLLAGSVNSPVNADWTYRYRQPSDCLFERRIVTARGAGVDPTPPPFQLSSDANGGLILTNQQAAVLEYTARPTCASLRGDALFRDALTWRHALSLAPGLTRMTDLALNAEKAYTAALQLADRVLRPGAPGSVANVALVDTTTTGKAANVSVVNRALVRIGASTIANLETDQSREARAALTVFEEELRATLRDVPWPFATAYAALVRVAGPTPPANADWSFSYRQPADCVFERRIVGERGAAVDPPPPPFQLSADANGGLVLTNQGNAVLEYTRRIDGAVLLGDGLFREAVAWRLAATLAPTLAQRRPEAVEQFGRGPDDTTAEQQQTVLTPPPTGVQLRGQSAAAAWEAYHATIARARAIHKPGNPGPLPDAPVFDPAPAHQLANTAVVNRALLHFGGRTIPALSSGQSREAVAARVVFEEEVRACLRDFPWPFATRYATLERVAGPNPPANADWTFSYRQPADCVFERRIVVTRNDAVNPTPPPFQLSSDDKGGLLVTNQPAAVLEYTARPEGAVAIGDSLFREALSWRLVAALAPSLAPADPDVDEQLGRGPDVIPSAPAAPRAVDQIVLGALKVYAELLDQARAVLRPGNPGTLPAAATVDVSDAAKAANLGVVNRALMRIGAGTIASLGTDQSREAQAARLVFEDDLRSTLYDFPWPFATKYATLEKVTGPQPPANADWTYAYRQPSDCIFERRIVVPREGAIDPTAPPFQLAADDTGGLLLTNQTEAVLEYTARLEGSTLRGDRLFRDALAWRLAMSLAPTLAPAHPETPEQIGRGPEDRGEPKDSPQADRQGRRVDAAQAYRMYLSVLAQAREILKPGVPGRPPATATVDTLPAQQAANVAVVNRALIRIGAQTIANIEFEQSREATAVRNIFEHELRSCLLDFPWAFATKYFTPTLAAGTDTSPVNADWTYAYALDASVLFVRRIVTDKRRHVEPNPSMFRLGTEDGVPVMYTETLDPTIETTVRPDGAVLLGDDVFGDVLAWRLAATLAPSLAQADPRKLEQTGRTPEPGGREPGRMTQGARLAIARWAWERSRQALNGATTADANEQQQDTASGDADWISGRN